jgi:hypothetical protein
MDFKEQLLEYRNSSESLPSLSNKTDLYFLEKYGTDGPGGEYTENRILIPGGIYFFKYSTNLRVDEKVKYINRNPLIFYLSSERVGENIIIKSIDLTLTPPEQRLEILKTIWEKFQPEIEENQKKIKRGESPNPIRIKSGDLQTLLRETGYKSSFCGFNYRFMSEIKWIDYSDWHKLPFLKYTLVQGLSVGEIYNNYRSKIKE